jgi:hypothetical protein
MESLTTLRCALQFSAKSRAVFHHPSRPSRPTVVSIHHPLFPSHCLFDLCSLAPPLPCSPVTPASRRLSCGRPRPHFPRSLFPCSPFTVYDPRFASSLVHFSLIHFFTPSHLHSFTSSTAPLLFCSLITVPCFYPTPHASGTHPHPFSRPHPPMPFCETVKL